MNDIEVLEEFIKYFEAEAISRKYRRNISITVGEDDIQAIENLLKERQSDKERIKDLEEENLHWRGQYHLLSRKIDSIPKSLLKEKIEELENKGEHYIFNEKDNAVRLGKIQVLEELLKGE